MRAGRKAKPTALKKAEGNPGKRPLNEFEVSAGKEPPKRPAYIKGISAKLWRELVELLGVKGMGVMEKSDGVALQMLCQVYAEWRRNDEIVQKHGGVYNTTTVSGDRIVRQLPQVRIAADAWRRLLAILAEFGLTPSSRQRFGGNENPMDDPIGQMIREAKKRRMERQQKAEAIRN